MTARINDIRNRLILMSFNELAWIDFLRKKVPKARDVLVGIGDDCGLVKIGRERILLKSDLFIEGVHFNRRDISFETLGMRAVGRVLSDFAACAGTPKFIGISVGAPNYIRRKNLKEILTGVLKYSKKYKFSLIGGDTSQAEKLFLDVWGIGVAEECILRSTAKVGDYVFLTGKLGARSLNTPFEPRIKEAKVLAKSFKVNAMIDISDGFIIDLYRMLRLSKKGAIVYRDNIPFKKGECDFYRGEDYELIFTIDKKERRTDFLKKKFYFVGRIKLPSFGYKWVQRNRLSNIKIRGYTHF